MGVRLPPGAPRRKLQAVLILASLGDSFIFSFGGKNEFAVSLGGKNLFNHMKLDSQPGLILSLSYLGIFLLSGIYMLYLLIFHTANSEFSGLFSILITLPWSIIVTPMLDSLGYMSWYNHFAGNPLVYGLLALLPLLSAALVNAIILYFIGRLFDNPAKNKNPENEIGVTVSAHKVNTLWKKFNLFFFIFFIMLFVVYLQIILPLPQYIVLISTLQMFAKVGTIVTLSYFGYAITLKKKYIFLGLLGLFPYMSAISLMIGYLILWQVKKKVIGSQSVSTFT
ncbi:MAG: hypothetical protein ABSA44_03335 [Bacteroidota bacterium]